uniref:Beta-glucosidase n=1 Tax=Acrobeloides nanus TaxID=290746 RepID=A0A914DEP6_9BILA
MRICCCGTDLCNNLSVNEPIRRTFAPDFMFGVATASYQVEGGAFADGKGPSIWDTFTHIPGTVKDNSTGDIACNSYELYETDIANIKYMGLNHYRFSLSWPRMFPSGRIDDPNPLGILYYDKLINLS